MTEPAPVPGPAGSSPERPRVRILAETDLERVEEAPPDRSDAFECILRDERYPAAANG